jgi:hypothetical protein
MAIKFLDTSDIITFSGAIPTNGVTTFSLISWFTPTDGPTGFPSIYKYKAGGSGSFAWDLIYAHGTSGGYLGFLMNWTVSGVWAVYPLVFTSNTLYQLILLYDGSSVANDASFYLNNVLQSIHEVGTPSGSLPADNGDIYIEQSIDGEDPVVFHKILLYSRILSASERAENLNSRGRWYPRNGLVFNPQLNGAKGLQTFDGSTLAAGNTILDRISGVSGIPSGSPVGISNKVLAGGWL